MSETALVWYFAYGANMARVVLVRRAVQPVRSEAASLPDHALRFDHPGVPPIEPVFANIAPAVGATVHGVAHLIAPGEARILDGLEPGYHRSVITVQLRSGETVEAFAYVSDTPCAPRLPSARYLGLLIDGGREHGLPAHVVAEWEALRGQAMAPAGTAPGGDPSVGAEQQPPGPLPADLTAEWERAAVERGE